MNLYDRNKTMQMIGNQIFPTGTEAANEIQKILDAHKPGLITGGHRGAEICSTMYDAFLLGMIYGKRAERQKRRQKAPATGGNRRQGFPGPEYRFGKRRYKRTRTQLYRV